MLTTTPRPLTVLNYTQNFFFVKSGFDRFYEPFRLHIENSSHIIRIDLLLAFFHADRPSTEQGHSITLTP